jgi:hypothetical protein
MRELTAIQVRDIDEPGRYRAGDGLWLQVTATKTGGVTKSWLLRYMLNGTARQMGLGSIKMFSLKEARDRAKKFRQQLADGIDPIQARREQRDAQRAEVAKRKTFIECAEAYIAAHEAGWRNAKHRYQWRATLRHFAYPIMGDLPVAAIDVTHVLQALEPIWRSKPETAGRTR